MARLVFVLLVVFVIWFLLPPIPGCGGGGGGGGGDGGGGGGGGGVFTVFVDGNKVVLKGTSHSNSKDICKYIVDKNKNCIVTIQKTKLAKVLTVQGLISELQNKGIAYREEVVSTPK